MVSADESPFPRCSCSRQTGRFGGGLKGHSGLGLRGSVKYSVGAIEIKVGFARENKGRQYSQLTSGFFKQVVARKAEHISQLVVLRQDRDLAQDSMRSQSLREIVTGSL